MNTLQANTKNISHEPNLVSFEGAKQEIAQKIQDRGDLPYVSVERQLELLDQLCQFDLGRFLVERRGLNGFWTHYIISHANPDPTLHPLENYLLTCAPVCLATQQRFAIFKAQIQRILHEGVTLASIPCGLMGDLLELDFLNFSEFHLNGIDIDPEALSQAKLYAEERGLITHCTFSEQNAWKLQSPSKFDVIVSNGLNIYESDHEKVIELYRRFYSSLKAGGTFITSFLTPPPVPGIKSEWILERVNMQDALLQKIIFSDILSTKWQVFREEELTRTQLIQAGFSDLEIFYDEAHLFPTVVAKKR